MSEEERGSQDKLGLRMAGVFLPTVVTAHLLSFWLPKPLAWASSIFAWMFAIHWIPPRPETTLRRWLIIVFVLSMLALLLAKFQPDMF